MSTRRPRGGTAPSAPRRESSSPGCWPPGAVTGRGPAAAVGAVVHRFGINAIEHRVTVTSLPAACRGLTRAQVNYAVGRALYAMTATVHGKAQRRPAAETEPAAGHLVSTVPAQPGQPPAPAAPPAAGASGPSSRPRRPHLVADHGWPRSVDDGQVDRPRRVPPGPSWRRRPPAVGDLRALGAGRGRTARLDRLPGDRPGRPAWTACGLLLPVAGLGMVLVLWFPERSLSAAPSASPAGRSRARAGPAPAPASPGPPRSEHPPVLIAAAHGVFAVATILFALLAAVGSS